MNWRWKARLQNLIAHLPYADPIYFGVQRTIGNLRRGTANPTAWFEATARMLGVLKECGCDATGKHFLEIGTGRMLGMPTALWLCGADQVTTIDINTYLSAGLVSECKRYIAAHPDEMRAVFGEYAKWPGFEERFQQLLRFRGNLKDYLTLSRIRYLSPASASHLPVADGTFDVEFSNAVFEHIPADEIHAILSEARRVLKTGGVMIHMIDPSDHFSHFDRNITAINFLQFSDREWERWAGNKFMYHNRLRSHEFLGLFAKAGIELICKQEVVDQAALAALNLGFPVADRFRSVPKEGLAVSSLLVVGTVGTGTQKQYEFTVQAYKTSSVTATQKLVRR